jgi:hypothetical protein
MNANVVTNETAHTEHQFSIEILDTPEQLRELIRLRYQVHCVEHSVESEEGSEGDR